MAVVVENVLSALTHILANAKGIYLILYFSSNRSITNNHSGDKQVHLLLWSWLKFCFRDEYRNLLLLIDTDFKSVFS